MIKNYEDVLLPRRSELTHLIWIFKKIDTVVAYKQKVRPTPNFHKESVLKDYKILEIVDKLSRDKCVPREFFITQAHLILDEIGFKKNLRVIRWLALLLVKMCLKMCEGIYVNTDSILHTKLLMGSCPVIFVPSHRSYADFVLMSFLCFTYDVEIPTTASGMDFHGMWGMGSILRDTGAFFMRRSYSDDILYWAIFKQYIHQLVTKGDLPIEFFIEGTRSRSNKSLMPKYGLLNMILKPLFVHQVPDILFVPISISYERILEEKLFAFELLGVPKPKESTTGFFKSLSILNDNYGSMHFTFGEPISCKKFFHEAFMNNSAQNIGPIYRNEMSDYEKSLIPPLAHCIVSTQQKMAVLKIINLIALILNHNLTNHTNLLTIEELKNEINDLKIFLERLGAIVWTSDLEVEIREVFSVHNNLLYLTRSGKIDVKRNQIDLTNAVKFKAYQISGEIMTNCIPFVMLHVYINPMLFFVVDMALLLIVLKMTSCINSDILHSHYDFLRELFIHEFVIHKSNISSEFHKALNKCLDFSMIELTKEGKYKLNQNGKFQQMLISTLQPFFHSYSIIMKILENFETDHCDEKIISTEVQKVLVGQMQKKFVHPYSLNLDTISNCLSTLILNGALKVSRSSTGITYMINHGSIGIIRKKLEFYTMNESEAARKILSNHKL